MHTKNRTNQPCCCQIKLFVASCFHCSLKSALCLKKIKKSRSSYIISHHYYDHDGNKDDDVDNHFPFNELLITSSRSFSAHSGHRALSCHA